MTAIWKFTLPMTCFYDGGDVLKMPMGAEILSCQRQDKDITFWARVAKDAPLAYRRFVIYSTGHPIDDDLNLEYISTVQMGSTMNPLVLHVFEVLS